MLRSDKRIHLISFDIPFPPNYGGIIDVYYKVKALTEAGIKVHLHCYQYGKEVSPQLNEICESVHYYRRELYKNPFVSKLPYIVKTRNTQILKYNLCQNNYPILFEGLHSCYHLAAPELEHRIKVVRMHNIEHNYYAGLAEVEANPVKKTFFRLESRRLKHFETILSHANHIAAISPNDFDYLNKKFKNVFYLPAFHSNSDVISESGKGNFALYHGNLGVGENDEAAQFLVDKVFHNKELKLVVAGNNPSPRLQQLISKSENVKLVSGIKTNDIDELIKQAQVNVLPTFQATGIKLKLINALYKGRYCVVNSTMVENTGLESLCAVADDPENFYLKIKEVMQRDFDLNEVAKRRELLQKSFSNQENISLLISRMFPA